MIATVGFVGLGRMGAPMVARLLAAGHAVRGHDPDPGAAAGLEGRAGFDRVESPAAAARGADAVILMLPDSDVVEQVVLGQGGLVDALSEEALLIDMSSSDPRRTQALAKRVRRLVDAPVSGGVRGAEAGTLTIMVGGDEADVASVRPLLGAMGAHVSHVGDAGAGHAVKALNNLLSATHLLATSEAMIAARAFGLDPARALEAINASSGRSGSTEDKWPRFVLPGTYDSGFSMRLMVKDMRTALALATFLGTPSPLAETANACWTRAAGALAEDADHTELVSWLEADARPGLDPSAP